MLEANPIALLTKGSKKLTMPATECPNRSASVLEAVWTSGSFWLICLAALSICSVKYLASLSFLAVKFWLMAASEAESRSRMFIVSVSMASSHSLCPGA